MRIFHPIFRKRGDYDAAEAGSFTETTKIGIYKLFNLKIKEINTIITKNV